MDEHPSRPPPDAAMRSQTWRRRKARAWPRPTHGADDGRTASPDHTVAVRPNSHDDEEGNVMSKKKQPATRPIAQTARMDVVLADGTRPHLTLLFDGYSRMILGWHIGTAPGA